MEIERMVDLVQANLGDLRLAAVGSCTRLESLRFVKSQEDRNHIFKVQTTSGEGYFLKLFGGPKPRTAMRELIGSHAMADLPVSAERLIRPSPVTVGPTSDFVLSGRLPGQALSRFTYASSIKALLHARATVTRTYHNLGVVLGALHTSPAGWVEPTNRGTIRAARRSADLVRDPRWIHRVRQHTGALEDREATVFVHGNLAFTNILTHQGRIGLIDFENCGIGHQLDDVARVLAPLFLMQLASASLRPVSDAATRALLWGYGMAAESSFDRLAGWLFLHLLHYYQTRFRLGEEGCRIALVFRVPRPHLASWIGRGPDGCREWLARRSD
jgi:Ser/Thr protein kinase RdoA (MazF antagonist)